MNKLLLLFLVALISCTSPYFHHEPLTKDDTFVLGTIILKLDREESVRGIGSGIYTWGIELQAREIATDKKVTAFSEDNEGFFYFTNLNPGLYRITHIKYKNSKGSSVGFFPQHKNIFTVKTGKVNNLGKLIVQTNMDNDESGYLFFKNHDEVKEIFTLRYPQSQWLDREWVHTRY